MTTKLSKKIMCLLLRNGIQIWLEEEQIGKLNSILTGSSESKIIKFDGQFFNTADITGIFSAETMQDYNRHRRGQWQDKFGGWHDRNEKIDMDQIAIDNIINKK